jgi:predicted RNA-binding Zn ribbon-like protein
MALPENISRAGTLHLIAGHLALDFANTASGRGSQTHQEHLRTSVNVLEWARHADILSASQAGRFREKPLPSSFLRDATRLRDIIYEIGEAIAERRKAGIDVLAELSAYYARMLASARLLPGRRRCSWAWENTPHRILGPIAQDAVDMLVLLDHTRIKQCAGHECGWLFYDETKNKSRRWCDMKVCGNRAKVRTARKRKAIK